MSDLNKLKKDLEKNSKLNVRDDGGKTLKIDSDYWGEIPADGKKPSGVIVAKNRYGFEVNAIDVGYARSELNSDTAKRVVEGLLKGNNLY